MRFNSNVPSSRERRRRNVTDYSSRKVQMRLVVLVFSVMTVLMLMYKVGQPETWEWLGFKDADSEEPQVPFDPKRIDTRIVIAPDRSTEHPDIIRVGPGEAKTPSSADVAGENGAAEADGAELDADADKADVGVEAATADAAKQRTDNHDFEIARRDFWEKTYAKLSVNEKIVLFQVLRSAKFNEALNQDLASYWPLLLEKLDARRTDYYAAVMQRVQSLPDDERKEKQRWLNTLRMLQQFWDEDLRVALSQFVQQSNNLTEQPLLTARQLASVDELLAILDKIALDQVEDNAMTSKRNDMQAWFGLFDRLRRSDDADVNADSVGPVSYVQLFEQPDFYRGKVVTVFGEVRGAYWVPAPQNALGIERYYVFWIRPQDGSNNPIAVYALDKPAGFPEIHQQNEDSDKEIWKEPVEVNAYFLKKWVYLSQDSGRLTPLLLAKSLDWKPIEPPAAAELPGIPAILVTILAVGLVAVAIAFFAYRLSSGQLINSQKSETEAIDFDPEEIARNISN